MASKNNLINFNTEGKNRLSDSQLKTEWGAGGIGKNEVAYSTLLNTLLIQMNQVTQSVADLVVNKVDNITLNSDGSDLSTVLDNTVLEAALNKVVTERAPDKRLDQTKNTIWAAPGTADGKPVFRALVEADIPDGLGSSKIASDAVTTAKIANSNVTTAKIADSNVTAVKLASDSVTTIKIADGNVTAVKLASDSVTTIKIADGNVTSSKIAESGVEETNIKDGAVTGGKVKDSSITTSKIANANVTADKIANGAVTTAKIALGAVTEGKIGESAVTAAKIKEGAVTDSKIASAGVFSSVVGILPSGGNASYKIRILSQSQYDGLSSYDDNTLYFIRG